MPAATEDFATYRTGLDSPARNAFAITPDNTNELSHLTRGIWVGGAGNLDVILAGTSETAVTLSAVPAGTLLPLQARIVKATSTATLIVGLY